LIEGDHFDKLQGGCFYAMRMRGKFMISAIVKRPFKKGPFLDSDFYKDLFVLALPIVLQNFITSSVNMLDTLMIGRVGEAEIAAVGIANQYFLLFHLIIIGIFSGCGVFFAQFWGKRDITNIRRVLGIGMIAASVVSLVFTAAAWIFPETIIAIFNGEPIIVGLGVRYLKIVSLSYWFTAASFGYCFVLRSTHNAFLPMLTSLLSLISNGILNYILIFGNFGAPALGVAGAAIATLIARFVEFAVLVIMIYKKREVPAATLAEMTDLSVNFIKRVVKTVIPVVLNESNWALAFVMYTVAYGRIGAQAIASVQICSTIQDLFLVITFGLSSAAAVMIGNKIGEDEMETARVYADSFALISFLTGLLLGAGLFACARGILTFFNVSDTVVHDSLMILYIYAATMGIRFFDHTLIVGILRGGGDAAYALKIEVLTMWLIGVPLAFAGAMLFKLPVYHVVALVTLEEIAKGVFGTFRLRSGRWINNVIHGM